MKRLILILPILGLCACAKSQCTASPGTGEEYVFIPSVGMWDDGKSSVDGNALDALNDINALVFVCRGSETSFVAEKSFFCTLTEEIPLMLDSTADYRIFMVANAGKNLVRDMSDGMSLETARNSVKIGIPSYTCTEVAGKGLPMVSDVYVKAGSGHRINFSFTRLYSRWRVKIDLSGSGYNMMTIKDARMVNAPLAVFPLKEESMISSSGDSGTLAGGDFASSEDIDLLNCGEPIYLYVLENVQGALLNGNRYFEDKIPDYLDPADAAKFHEENALTYIELQAEVCSPRYVYGNARIRFFLGEDVAEDFSIRRNSSYELSLHLGKDSLRGKDWIFELGSATGSFSPRLDMRLEGYSNTYGCWAPRVRMECRGCEQLVKYGGDFTPGIGVSLLASGQHSARIIYRNSYAWKQANKTFLANGGKLEDMEFYHSATYEGGAMREGYYDNECSIAVSGYERKCSAYSWHDAGAFFYNLGDADRSGSASSFIVLVKPDLCAGYASYTEDYSYTGPPRYEYDWSWIGSDYTSGNNSLNLQLYVSIPEETVTLLDDAYGIKAVDFVKASCTLANSFPYGSSTFSALGYHGIRVFVNGEEQR